MGFPKFRWWFWPGIPDKALYLWCNITGSLKKSEAVFQDVNLANGYNYKLQFDYTLPYGIPPDVLHVEFTQSYQPCYSCCTSTTHEIIPSYPANQYNLTSNLSLPTMPYNYWIPVDIDFTYNSAWGNRITIFPQLNQPNSINQAHIKMDNITIKPNETISIDALGGTCEYELSVDFDNPVVTYPITSYQWSDGGQIWTTSTITVSPAQTTTYYVTITYANGCEAVAQKEIVPNGLEFSIDDINICLPNTQIPTFQLSAIQNGASPYTYQWAPASGLTSTTVAQPGVTLSTPGSYVYSVTVTDDSNCKGVAYATVNVYDPPDKPQIEGYNNNCDGEEGLMYTIANYDLQLQYAWSLSAGAGNFLGGNTGQTVYVNWNTPPALPDYFEIYVTTTNTLSGCLATDTMRFYECCQELGPSDYFLHNTSLDFDITDATIGIQGNINITDDVTLLRCEIRMALNQKSR
ncbi:MAG: hypothetical protein RQ866_06055 [Bacteroidales bacterium]|nr:hypothetical protein [Bacteroidales bacterium]